MEDASSGVAEISASSRALDEMAEAFGVRINDTSSSVEELVRSVHTVSENTAELSGAANDTAARMRSMAEGMQQQNRAVASGHWPLIRYNPIIRESGGIPFTLDCLRPTLSLAEYRRHEGRYRALARENQEEADRLMEIAQRAAHLRWDIYEKMAGRTAADFPADPRRD